MSENELNINARYKKMRVKQLLAGWLSILVIVAALAGCAEKEPVVEFTADKISDYSSRLGQANVKLYMYSGTPKLEDVKVYAEKLGCNMLYAYFYPDTVPLSKIPVEEIRSAKSFAETQEILFNGEGYARWSFASQCLAVIPIVADCNERFGGQICP